MGYDLQKRLALLQEQAEQAKYKSLRFSRTAFISFLLITFFIIAFLNPITSLENKFVVDRTNIKSAQQSNSSRLEQSALEKLIIDRTNFLSRMPLGSKATNFYGGFSRRLVSLAYLPATLNIKNNAGAEINPFDHISAQDLSSGIASRVISFLLRLLFILIAFAPFWIIAAICGFAAIKYFRSLKGFDPILSICDRGKSVFYSGIYGPFRLNDSFSATNIACPGLACPNQVAVNSAINHNLVKTLKNYNAFCETTLGLVQIILAYPDYPCIVDEEKPVEEETDVSKKNKNEILSVTGYASNEEGTIEKNSEEILPALLSVHRMLREFFRPSAKRKTIEEIEFERYQQFVAKISPKCSPLMRLLLNLMTPLRAHALAVLSPSAIACAYLSIEAGKCLVYKKVENHFIKISQFPHLQARAVLHSVVSYHNEFDGDNRLIIRQAILCSRRHGDFARSFLPENMPLPSRALRDVLEVLSAPRQKKKDIATITELDANIEEVMHNWRDNLAKHTESLAEEERSSKSEQASSIDKGLVFKSVVLIPQDVIISLALQRYPMERLERISSLIRESKKLSKLLAVSARLPGFQRQADKLDGLLGAATVEGKVSDEDKWIIIHRMLTRYNWLSTRVGDDGVPDNGIVFTVVVNPANDARHPEILGFPTMVPLRQRRFRDLFGPNWERDYFGEAVHPDNITVFVDTDSYASDLATKKELSTKGILDATNGEDLTLGKALIK
ncbi:MAG: hypothetical protein IT292_12410 [Deltaproteobacteria bacterium]|nr:hypothetical protein [Deltaproteobacteria bacterium]